MESLAAKNVRPAQLDMLSQICAQEAETPLGSVLAAIVNTIRSGQELVVGGADEELSPSKAADILSMSRPHLYKLLDQGVIKHHRVGRDRRIRLGDLAEFMVAREAARCDLAETFAHVEQTRRRITARMAGVDEETARRLGF